MTSERPKDVVWSAREAFAIAYCWSEFETSQLPDNTPESYWLGITECARNRCRSAANDLLLLSVTRGQAVVCLPVDGLRVGEFKALMAALDMKSEHRVRAILDAVQRVFRRKPAVNEQRAA